MIIMMNEQTSKHQKNIQFYSDFFWFMFRLFILCFFCLHFVYFMFHKHISLNFNYIKNETREYLE